MTENRLCDSGLERLCVAVFKQIKEDYGRDRRIISNPKKTEDEKNRARRDIAVMDRQVRAGYMDLYAEVFPDMEAEQIWEMIKKLYEMGENSSVSRKAVV